MDIDIDTPASFDPTELFDCVRASMVQQDQLVKHNVGVYFQNIARDPITGLAAIPYKQAEEYGFTKIDFLHINVLNSFTSKKQIRQLLKIEPDWELMQDESVCKQLFQLSNHHDLVMAVKPTSVQEVADCIALIRPAKKHLIPNYINNKEKTREQLYELDSTKGTFKKSHAVSYALNVKLQLHLIKANRYSD